MTIMFIFLLLGFAAMFFGNPQAAAVCALVALVAANREGERGRR